MRQTKSFRLEFHFKLIPSPFCLGKNNAYTFEMFWYKLSILLTVIIIPVSNNCHIILKLYANFITTLAIEILCQKKAWWILDEIVYDILLTGAFILNSKINITFIFPSVLDVFRKIDFGPDPEGHGRLNVFQLHSNPSYYLATTNLRHLELQVCKHSIYWRHYHFYMIPRILHKKIIYCQIKPNKIARIIQLVHYCHFRFFCVCFFSTFFIIKQF